MTKTIYQQYHQDVPLTNLSVAYTSDVFVAPQLFPIIPVQRLSDKYFVYNKGDWRRRQAEIRAPGTRAPRGGYSLSTGNYLCAEWSFATTVTDEQVRNSNAPLSPLSDGTKFVTHQLLAEMESQVAATAFGSSVWSGSATPSTLWSVPSSTPMEDVETGFETIVAAIGNMPNVGIMGYNVFSDLKNHPDIVERIKYTSGPTSPAIVTLQALAHCLV